MSTTPDYFEYYNTFHLHYLLYFGIIILKKGGAVILHKNKKITIKVAGRVTSITMQEMLFRLLSLKLSQRTDDVRTVSKWLEKRLTDHLGESTLSIGRESTISGLSAYCSRYALEEVAQVDLLKIVDDEYYNTE